MNKSSDDSLIISIRVQIRKDALDAFLKWQAKFNAIIPLREGFISLEFLAITDFTNEWVIIQRFQNKQYFLNWQKTSEYQSFLSELKSLQENSNLKIDEQEAHCSSMQSGLSEFFVVEVKPEREADFLDWVGRIHKEQAKFPGFRSTYVQSPKQGKGKNWVTFIQFDTREHLESWLNSEKRLACLEEAKDMISYIESHRVISPFAGWFSDASTGFGEAPPVWKQSMIVLLILFPIVMLEMYYLSPRLKGLDSSFATFIANALTVTLIAWPSMPIAIKFLRWWLIPINMTTQKSVLGTLLLIGLYLLEIAFFWKVFNF